MNYKICGLKNTHYLKYYIYLDAIPAAILINDNINYLYTTFQFANLKKSNNFKYYLKILFIYL